MKNFEQQKLEKVSLDPYREIMRDDTIVSLEKVVGELKGVHVLHINSAANAGGVAELLKSNVPIEISLGLNSSWIVMKGEKKFFEVTKHIHNCLQGKEDGLSEEEKKTYFGYIKSVTPEIVEFAKDLANKGKLVIILHDPQPLPLIDQLKEIAPVISRLHIDLSKSNKDVLELLKPYLLKADRVIVSDEKFRPEWIPEEKAVYSYPAIDPFIKKNIEIPKEQVEDIFKKVGIDTSRPLITQISRFDPWKDPKGVVEAYRIVKKDILELQLALVGFIVAEDDPEAEGIYTEMQELCRDDTDVHLFGEKAPPHGIANDDFVNAFQKGSKIVLQKSLQEGFGLTVSEAMWKKATVIGGNVGGIKHQIEDGKSGFLVSSVQECADRINEILVNKKLDNSIGEAAHERVRSNFLMPRMVLEQAKVYKDVLTLDK